MEVSAEPDACDGSSIGLRAGPAFAAAASQQLPDMDSSFSMANEGSLPLAGLAARVPHWQFQPDSMAGVVLAAMGVTLGRVGLWPEPPTGATKQ